MFCFFLFFLCIYWEKNSGVIYCTTTIQDNWILLFKSNINNFNTAQLYRHQFGDRIGHSQSIICQIIKCFQRVNTVADLLRAGRPHLRTQDAINQAAQSVEQNPESRRALQLGMLRTTLRRILHTDLIFFPPILKRSISKTCNYYV